MLIRLEITQITALMVSLAITCRKSGLISIFEFQIRVNGIDIKVIANLTLHSVLTVFVNYKFIRQNKLQTLKSTPGRFLTHFLWFNVLKVASALCLNNIIV